jgi:hypothetical protein
VIQPNGLVDDFSRKAEAAVRVGRRAHARDPAIRPNLRQPDNTFRPEFGTRELRRLIYSELETQLAHAMLADEVHEGDRVAARWDREQKVVFELQAQAEAVEQTGSSQRGEDRGFRYRPRNIS